MKIAIISDIHFGSRADSVVFLDDIKSFMKNVFFPKIDELGIKHIINLGDTFDRRKFVNYNTLKVSHECFFDEISKRGIIHDVMIGNHDTYYKTTSDVNCYDTLLLNQKWHRIYSRPQQLTMYGKNFLFVPWINASNEEESMRALNNAPHDSIVCGHFELSGFETQRGNIMEHGMDPVSLHRFDLVLSGHYHHRSSKERIHYVGSPVQTTWADYGDRRGFHILDTETLTLEFIENPESMFTKIIYDDIDGFNLPTKESLLHLSGKYVKVIIRNKNDAYTYDRFRDILDSVGIFNLSTYDEKLMTISGDSVEIDGAQSTEMILDSYINTIPNIDNMVREDLRKLVGNLYKEAMDMEIA